MSVEGINKFAPLVRLIFHTYESLFLADQNMKVMMLCFYFQSKEHLLQIIFSYNLLFLFLLLYFR